MKYFGSGETGLSYPRSHTVPKLPVRSGCAVTSGSRPEYLVHSARLRPLSVSVAERLFNRRLNWRVASHTMDASARRVNVPSSAYPAYVSVEPAKPAYGACSASDALGSLRALHEPKLAHLFSSEKFVWM